MSNSTETARMPWPTAEEVDAADAVRLAKWYRFLPVASRAEHARITNRISRRFNEEMGGMTRELSKEIGWVYKE